jgi:tight adherence protein B
MAIVSFSDAAVVETGFTDDVDQLTEAIDEMVAPSDGGRATWDGVRKATTLFQTREDLQPNLVVVTNGADDSSRLSAEEARASVVSSGAAFFTVELGTRRRRLRAASRRSWTAPAALPSRRPTPQGSRRPSRPRGHAPEPVRRHLCLLGPSGQVDVGVSIGNLERKASYVAGANVQGAATAEVVQAPEGFGPAWLARQVGRLARLGPRGARCRPGCLRAGVVGGHQHRRELNAAAPVLRGPRADVDNEGALAQTALLQRAVEITEDFAERQGFLVKVEHALERADLPLRAAEAMFFYMAARCWWPCSRSPSVGSPWA